MLVEYLGFGEAVAELAIDGQCQVIGVERLLRLTQAG